MTDPRLRMQVTPLVRDTVAGSMRQPLRRDLPGDLPARHPGGVVFIHLHRGQSEACLELARKALAGNGVREGLSVGMTGATYHQTLRLPSGYQHLDSGEDAPVVAPRDRLERTRTATEAVADRHTDPFRAVVKTQTHPGLVLLRSGQGAWNSTVPLGRSQVFQACPAADDRNAGWIPRSPKACRKRSSAGTSKISAGEAGTVSQALAAISSSSCPSPQPA